MPDYAVSTAFIGKDKGITALFEKMERAAKSFGSGASSALDRVSRSSDRTHNSLRNTTKAGHKFGTIVKGILTANALRGGIGMVGGALQRVGTDFLDFDDTMVASATQFDDIGVKAERFGDRLEELEKKWMSFARGSRFGMAEIAKAGEYFASSGWKSAAAEGLMPYFLKSARANRVEDLDEYVKAMVSIHGGFRLKTGDPVKDSQTFVTMLDQITQGAADAIGGVTDLKESLKVLAPIWKNSETTASTIAYASVLQNAGFPYDMIATAGKNAKMRLARQDIAEGLGLSGINVEDPKTGKLKSILQLFEEIDAKMKKLGIKPGSKADMNIQEKLFGLYAVAGNQSMLQALGDYRKEIERIEKSSGVAGERSDLIAKYSSKDKFLVMRNALMMKGAQVLNHFNRPGQSGLDGLIERIEKFDPRGFIEAFATIGTAIKGVWTVIEPFVPYLPVFLKAWLGWQALIGGMKVARFAGEMIGLLKIALAFSPWVVIIGAIIAGLVFLEVKFKVFSQLWKFLSDLVTETIVPAIGKAWDWLGDKIAAIVNLMSRPITTPVKWLWNQFDPETQDAIMRGLGGGVEAPNKREAEARAGGWHGRLDVAAPSGSTISGKSTGMSTFETNLLGVNP